MHSWSGEASNWECDELGHLNMRHYMYKVGQARQMLFIRLGLPHAFKKGAHSTVRVDEFHIKYLAEARPGAPLHIHSAVLDISETSMRLIHVMRHYDGRPACSVTETVSHIARRTGEAFNWPSRLRDAAPDYRADLPDFAAPRGLDLSLPSSPPAYDAAQALGMTAIGVGVFQKHEGDIFGAIPPEAILGRVTETVGNFVQAWPEMILEGPGRDRSISGALFEARVIIHNMALTGEPYEFFSGIRGVNANVRDLVHCLYSPLDGRIWASMQGIGGLMDLKARKHVKTSAQTIADMSALMLDGLNP